MEFKHFSHHHGLSFHQTPETREVICSGCKSPASSGSVYSCWQCNFFLHEQCFNAARSMNHTSHPSHPLSLFPYPTYPSNSFFCNFCNLSGTGFSYSCSSCEFDLHVHCASMPVTTTHDPYPSFANQNHSMSQETPRYDAQYGYNTPEHTAFGNVFSSLTPQYTFPSEMAPSSNASIGQLGQVLSTNQPPHLPPYTSELYPPNPPYPYTTETISHQSVIHSPKPSHASPNQPLPMSGHPIEPHRPKYGLQTQPSIHQRIPHSVAYDSNGNGPDQQHAEAQHVPPYTSEPHPSNQPHPYIPVAEVSKPAPPQILPREPPPNMNVQTGVHTLPGSYQQTHPQLTTTSTNQSVPESAIHQNSADGPQQQPPPNKDLKNSNPQADVKQPRNLKHFSHHHALRLSEVEEEDYILCSGCEQHLSGSACRCTKPKCDFQLHKSCFELSREIPHKSHPEHPLVLLSAPPYKENGEFTCNACSSTGTAFDYHCKVCQFDLHVKCATLSENIKREDHEHTLKLLFSSPYKKGEENNEDLTFYCDVCHSIVEEGCWVYYCQECDFGTHLDCVMADREDPDEEAEQLSEADSLLAAQMRLQQLQFQVQMNRQAAQMTISMGQSLANLV